MIDQKEFNRQRNLVVKYESLFKSIFDLDMRDFYSKNPLDFQDGFNVTLFENILKDIHPDLKDADIGALLVKYKKVGDKENNKALWLIMQLL